MTDKRGGGGIPGLAPEKQKQVQAKLPITPQQGFFKETSLNENNEKC